MLRPSSLLRLTAAGVMSAAIAACSDSPVETGSPTIGPVSMNIVSGDGQGALANTELPNPLVVQVVDSKGHAVRDQIVNFRVVAGGGSVYAGASLTDKDGMAQDYWTLGASGAQTVQVRAVDPSTGQKQVFATFNATITLPPPPPTFDPDAFEPNNAWQVAPLVANLTNGQSVSISANLNTLTDVDWFEFHAIDVTNPGCSGLSLSEDFTFRATLSNVPSGSVYRISIADGPNVLVNGTSGPVTLNYSGSCGTDDGRNLYVQVDRISGPATAAFYSLAVSLTEQ